MRQVVSDALYSGFEYRSKNTPLEGAEVKIQQIPIGDRALLRVGGRGISDGMRS